MVIEVSHPDLIKLSGDEAFKREPFMSRYHSGTVESVDYDNGLPVKYSSNGAQVRLIKGERWGRNLENIAKGGETRLSVNALYDPTRYYHKKFHLNFSNMRFLIGIPDDGNRELDTVITNNYTVEKFNWRGVRAKSKMNDFEGKKIEGESISSYADYYSKRVPKDGSSSPPSRAKSVGFDVGYIIQHREFGNIVPVVPNFEDTCSLPCGPDITVSADSIEILYDLGNILLLEYRFPYLTTIVSTKTLAENAWVKITIPIDLKWD